MFQSNRVLKHIALAHNLLKQLPLAIFRYNTELQTIKLYGNDFTKDSHLCSLEKFASRIVKLEVKIKKYLQLIDGKCDTDCRHAPRSLRICALCTGTVAEHTCQAGDCAKNNTYFSCNDKELTQFPINVADTTTFLSVRTNMIEELQSEQFRALGHLEYLDLSDNRLAELPFAIFDCLTELRSLFLCHNVIKILSPVLFKHNIKLQNLYLGFNLISSLPGELFSTNQQLLTLEVQDNFLKGFPKQLFLGTPRLTSVNLINDRLEVFDLCTLSHISNIELVGLHDLDLAGFLDTCSEHCSVVKPQCPTHSICQGSIQDYTCSEFQVLQCQHDFNFLLMLSGTRNQTLSEAMHGCADLGFGLITTNDTSCAQNHLPDTRHKSPNAWVARPDGSYGTLNRTHVASNGPSVDATSTALALCSAPTNASCAGHGIIFVPNNKLNGWEGARVTCEGHKYRLFETKDRGECSLDFIQRWSRLLFGNVPANIWSGEEERFLSSKEGFGTIHSQNSGFPGSHLIFCVDICFNTPCKNGGVCLKHASGNRMEGMNDTSYYMSCNCSSSWSGEYCEDDVDECTEVSPAVNCTYPTTQCVNMPGSYYCDCPAGFDNPSRNCTSLANACANHLCQNGATCVNGHVAYNCTCPPGWHGQLCDIKDSCIGCSKNGYCQLKNASYHCQCHPLFYGPQCTSWYRNETINGRTNVSYCTAANHYMVLPPSLRVASSVSTATRALQVCQAYGMALPGRKDLSCMKGVVDTYRAWFTATPSLYVQNAAQSLLVFSDESVSPADGQGNVTVICVAVLARVCRINGLEQRIWMEADKIGPASVVSWQAASQVCNGSLYNPNFLDLCALQFFRDVRKMLGGRHFTMWSATGINSYITTEDDMSSSHFSEPGDEHIVACVTNECEQNSSLCSGRVEDRCVLTEAGYECQCQPGFTGQKCTTPFDVCLPNPCQQGRCVTVMGEYQCHCQHGWLGRDCDIEDPCVTGSHNCTRGVCVTSWAPSHTCSCHPGYTGHTCSARLASCTHSVCVNGTCVPGKEEHTCKCHTGYTGVICDVDVSECSSNPCVNGQCLNVGDRYLCTCDRGWSGETCADASVASAAASGFAHSVGNMVTWVSLLCVLFLVGIVFAYRRRGAGGGRRKSVELAAMKSNGGTEAPPQAANWVPTTQTSNENLDNCMRQLAKHQSRYGDLIAAIDGKELGRTLSEVDPATADMDSYFKSKPASTVSGEGSKPVDESYDTSQAATREAYDTTADYRPTSVLSQASARLGLKSTYIPVSVTDTDMRRRSTVTLPAENNSRLEDEQCSQHGQIEDDQCSQHGFANLGKREVLQANETYSNECDTQETEAKQAIDNAIYDEV
ncbi:slit homolog 3 protein-like [Sycon ciliatum]|uniref:slit homolog 3 protein-like n=1 Tax=Sycon ciliatum TaxID=27933 RepID=UPI0031F6517F